MRAVVVSDVGRLDLQNVDLEPQAGEVVLRVKDCGICGSDLHAVRFPDAFGTAPGTVMGHEFSGEVVEAPEGGDWKPGDRVVALPVVACGACPECDAGYDWRCRNGRGIGLSRIGVPGAFAEYVRAGTHDVFGIPDALSYRHAALTEPLAVGLHAVNRAGLQAGESCLIMGAGAVGLFTLIWARLRGAEPIVVSDPAPARRDQAVALGAHLAVNPADQDPSVSIRELTHGQWPSVVFECVGTPPTLEEACRLAARDGRVAVTGVCLQPYELRPMTAHGKELDLRYVFAYTRNEFQEALAALSRGDIPADGLITDVIDLDDVPAMFQTLAQPTTQVKVLVEPGLGGS